MGADGDGLTDYVESLTTFTDPWNPDTDSDGLSDGVEVRPHGTNPLNADTDEDTALEHRKSLRPAGAETRRTQSLER